MNPRTIKLIIEYDGTEFAGWQIQPKQRTIQGEIESALKKLLKHFVRIHGSGRTDAGVHALGQVASFKTMSQAPLRAFREGLNSLLPRDIAILFAEEVSNNFDARRSASGKRYQYKIFIRETRSPILQRFAWWQRRSWQIEPLKTTVPFLLGTHDFSSFRASNCQAKHPIRTLHAIQIDTPQEKEIVITFEATAFLKHMVRNLVGTLAEVALGQKTPKDVKKILAARNRQLAGPTAPPQGLTLLEVFYEKR